MKPRITILEGSPIVASFLNRLLEGNYELTICENPRQAYRSLHKSSPSLIIIDNGIPGFDSVSFLQKINQMDHLRGVPILLMTGNKKHTHNPKFIQLGVSEILLKPFKPYDLVSKAQEYLSIPSK